MTHTTKWIALAGLSLALLAMGAPASAQTPTAEGTVITNTAHANWTDANGNTYTEVTGSVSVTVGFLSGIDAATATATVTPGSPGTGNEVTFTIHNLGNGRDSISLAMVASAGLTVTGYKFEGTTYGTIAALNTYLAAHGIGADSTISVIAVYDVATGQEGNHLSLALTAASVRVPATNDAQTIAVDPVLANGIEVTPDASAISRLPSKAPGTYTATFTVKNTSNGSRDIDLAGSHTGAALTIVSVNGGTSSITVASGASQSVDIVYTVDDVAAGVTDNLKLTGTIHATAFTDDGSYAVTVIRPALTVAKEAYTDADVLIGAGVKVLPGEYIKYKITVTNTGTADASTVVVTDALPAQVTYDTNTPDAAGWTIGEAAGTVTATLTGALAPGAPAARFFWIRVRIK